MSSAAPPPPPRPQFTNPSIDQKLQVIGSATGAGFTVEILAYDTLSGSDDPTAARTLYYANQTGLKLKQVKISLRRGEAIAEAGALQYLHGRIEIDNPVGGLGGMGKAMLKKMLTQETAYMPRYRGSGTIYLEPSFGDFLIFPLANDELIADKGLFYCGEGSLTVGIAAQKNVSSALLGGEGFFQTRIQGTGIAVFELPVPADEVRCVELQNETLQVDGSFALMRTGRIDFSVERSAKGIGGTLGSGEGLLQTFRGTGKVWIAPTQPIYQRLRLGGFGSVATS